MTNYCDASAEISRMLEQETKAFYLTIIRRKRGEYCQIIPQIAGNSLFSSENILNLFSPGKYTPKGRMSHCALPKVPAWPRGIHSIRMSLSAQFKSSYSFIQSVPAKFKVLDPLPEDFTPPSSPQRWNIQILSWPTDSQGLGPILPYLSAFGLIWLCVWVDRVRIILFNQ